MDELIAKVVKKHYPEIALGLHVPVWAVVVAIAESTPAEAMSSEFRPYMSVDLKVLARNGELTDIPTLQQVPLASMARYPEPGHIVEISFGFGLINKPYVSSILPYNLLLPELKPGEVVSSTRSGVESRIDDAGNITTKTDRQLTLTSVKHMEQTGVKHTIANESLKDVAGHNMYQVGGTHNVEALGAIRHLTAGQLELGALESIEVATASDLNENIAGSRKASINEALEMVVQGKGKLNIDEDGVTITTESGKVHIGNEQVNIVSILQETIDLLSQALLTLSMHTHPVPSLGTSLAATNAGDLGGQAALAEGIITRLSPIT